MYGKKFAWRFRSFPCGFRPKKVSLFLYKLRLRLHYSKSLRIHTKIISGFVDRLHRKKYMDWLHARVKAKSAFLSKHGHKSPHILLKITLENRKIPFHSFFITASNKKLSHHWLLRLSFTKTRKISPESKLSGFKLSGFKVSRFFSGFVSNPKTFCTGFVSTLNPKKKSPDCLRIRRNSV